MLPSLFVLDLRGDEFADQIADMLADLGDTADAIAYHLGEARITGARANASHCPIANYLRRAMPCIESVEVCDAIDAWTASGEHVSLRTPVEVYDFVCLFDIERYPHLIASPQLRHPAEPDTTHETEDQP